VQGVCEQRSDLSEAVWLEAAEICKGDIVYSSPLLLPVRVAAAIREYEEEEVYNLEIEEADCFLTDIGLVRSVAVM